MDLELKQRQMKSKITPSPTSSFPDGNQAEQYLYRPDISDGDQNSFDASGDLWASSVWCHDGENQMCQFHNICYNSDVDEFVIFLNDSSILENVAIRDGAINIDLSSVRDHNNRQLMISVLANNVIGEFSIDWINDTTLLFQRFLPENVMHMFHDDIIPLHHTLRMIQYATNKAEYSPFNVSLYLYEDFNTENDVEIDQYYAMFSKYKLKFKNSFKTLGKLTCFRNMYAGLFKATVWYDYGFFKSQGPVDNLKVQAQHIRTTANFVRQSLAATGSTTTVLSSKYIVLFNRKENRRILNVADLTINIVKAVGHKVISLDLDTYALKDLISYVHNSSGIIGMHGSLMILTMFLKPGAFVLELFPYAINPKHYTPYKTLCGISGINIHYESWTNQKAEKSVGHPDWPPEVGGLMHLPEKEREVIMKQMEVPKHLCCSDPSWLHHIYQDTVVDVEEIIPLISKALDVDIASEDIRHIADFYHFSPSKVQNVTCLKSCHVNEPRITECHFTITWDVPWTLQYIKYNKLFYEILVQYRTTEGRQEVVSEISDLNNAKFKVFVKDVADDLQFYIWVRGVIDNDYQGPFSGAVLCLPETN